ncbi:MAG TPA: glycosyltransferase family 1 protein [Niabella sp.]|nr:glycosyltransferase family 1 protein [Niabella sp.]
MKRIGIEVQRLFRKKKHGMEVVALELIKELQQMDHKNEYVLFVKDDEDNTCISETPNWKIKTLSGKTYFDWEQFSLPKAIKNERIDFLHSTCNTSALRSINPLLLTLHDIIYLEKIDFKGTAYQNFGNLYRRFVVPRVAQKSKFIITVSHFEKEVICEKLKLPEEKVKVVYNAVNKKFNNQYERSLVEGIRKKYNLPHSFILFLGNTAPKKNTGNVIDAYAKYCGSISDPLPLVILDYDRQLIIERLKANKQEELFKNFILPGFISSDEMPLLYNAATLFLYPSLRESFGLPILEAMGCGTPVITSSTSSMPEVAADAALFVDPYNVNDITKKIEDLISNPELQSELIKKGLQRSADFTWNKAARELMDIYEMM